MMICGLVSRGAIDSDRGLVGGEVHRLVGVDVAEEDHGSLYIVAVGSSNCVAGPPLRISSLMPVLLARCGVDRVGDHAVALDLGAWPGPGGVELPVVDLGVPVGLDDERVRADLRQVGRGAAAGRGRLPPLWWRPRPPWWRRALVVAPARRGQRAARAVSEAAASAVPLRWTRMVRRLLSYVVVWAAGAEVGASPGAPVARRFGSRDRSRPQRAPWYQRPITSLRSNPKPQKNSRLRAAARMMAAKVCSPQSLLV